MTVQQPAEIRCSVCGKSFQPRFRYQVQELKQQRRFYCSQLCMLNDVNTQPTQTCSTCGKQFTPEFAFQVAIVNGEARYYCSDACRAPSQMAAMKRKRGTRRIAVLNQKGGTGKTSTAVNVAAAFAARGHSTLLVDMDPQGNVGVSLGIHGTDAAYNLMLGTQKLNDLAVPIRSDLEVVPSSDTLAQADIDLVPLEKREFKLRERLRSLDNDFDFVILDCAPSLSLLNKNTLLYAEEVVIPVSCDYLSLVGVKQVLKTLDNINKQFDHRVKVAGVIPTFFDTRTNISHEVIRNLQNRFKDAVLPPVRINTRIKEAPIYKQTIFEYAPDSNGAEDYLAIAGALLSR